MIAADMQIWKGRREPYQAIATSSGSKTVFVEENDRSDRDLLVESVARIVVCKDRLLVTLRSSDVDQEDSHDPVIENVYNGELRKAFKPADGLDAQQLSIPFIANQPLIKGLIVGYGAEPTAIDAKTREVLLLAIARSTAWIQQVVSAQRSSFEEIGAGEHLAERYVRRLVQLAFISPKIIAAIDAGTAPSGLTIARLTQSMPYAWMKQEQLLGIV